MARYFFHLRDGTDEILDPEGVELDFDEMTRAAIMAARDCMAADVKAGRLDLRYRIEVQDEAGRVIHTLPFPNALEIIS